MRRYRLLSLAIVLSLCSTPMAFSAPRTLSVSNYAELKKALAEVGPGVTVEVAPGMYEGGIYLNDVHGTAEEPIVITGADPANPPVFTSKGEGAKLSRCSYVKLSHLVFQKTAKNGINIDDGGKGEAASHHLLLEDLEVRDIGPKGNVDALKMSGLEHFVVRDCRFENWGGSAIDMVGCRNGLIEGCQLLGGGEGYRNANGIQIKGGSRFILVQTSFFRNAGARVINLGGMTGLQFFRPEVGDFEARDVILAGNTFIGSEAQVAWVTAQESLVHHNLFFLPGKWVGRILQETKDQRFKPSGKGLFENNMVVMDGRVGNLPFNVGRGTDPDSFVFRGNAWFRPDSDRKPTLPSLEKDGIYDLDPMILDLGAGSLVANTADPRIKQVGPWDYRPWKPAGDFTDIAVPPVVLPEP